MKDGTWVISVSSGEIYEIIYKTGSGYRAKGLSGNGKSKSVYFQKKEVVPYWLQRYDQIIINAGRYSSILINITGFDDFQFYTDNSIYNENVLINQFEDFRRR